MTLIGRLHEWYIRNGWLIAIHQTDSSLDYLIWQFSLKRLVPRSRQLDQFRVTCNESAFLDFKAFVNEIADHDRVPITGLLGSD